MDRFSFRDLRDCKNAHFSNRLEIGGSAYSSPRQGLYKFELAWAQALLTVVPSDRYYDCAFYSIIEAAMHLQLGFPKEASFSLFYAVNKLSFLPKVPSKAVLGMVREILDFLPPEDNQVTWDEYRSCLDKFNGNRKQHPPQSKNRFALSLFKPVKSRQLSKCAG